MQWSCGNGHNFLEDGSKEQVMESMLRGCPICQQEVQKHKNQNEELATLIADKVTAALKPFLVNH